MSTISRNRRVASSGEPSKCEVVAEHLYRLGFDVAASTAEIVRATGLSSQDVAEALYSLTSSNVVRRAGVDARGQTLWTLDTSDDACDCCRGVGQLLQVNLRIRKLRLAKRRKEGAGSTAALSLDELNRVLPPTAGTRPEPARHSTVAGSLADRILSAIAAADESDGLTTAGLSERLGVHWSRLDSSLTWLRRCGRIAGHPSGRGPYRVWRLASSGASS